MKRLFSFLIVLAVCTACSGAFAASPGNLNNGSFLVQNEDHLYIATQNGILRTDLSGRNAVRIETSPASMLQFYEGRLYYLSDLYGEDLFGDVHVIAQTPMSCLPDGSDKRILGEEKALGEIYEYPENENDSFLMDSFIGYRNFTVYDGSLYYLANSNEAGTYVCSDVLTDENGDPFLFSIEGEYNFGIALYKSDLNGENVSKLTDVIGNRIACMAIQDGRIYLAGGYADTVYAYNHVNYSVLTLSGETLTAYENTYPSEISITCDKGSFYHITEAVLPMGDELLASLSDSEGDFVSSRLTRLSPDGASETLALEMGFVPSLLDGSTLYYTGSASETVFYNDEINYSDSYGIYRKDVNEQGAGVRIAAIPYDDQVYGISILKEGEYVYYALRSGEIHRVHVETGEHSVFTDKGFI